MSGYSINAQRQIEDIDILNLNQEQRFAANIIHQNMYSKILIIIMGELGTRKSAAFKAVTKILYDAVQNITSVIRLGTTGIAAFVISGATCHYVLVLLSNIPFNDLNGSKIQHSQQHLYGTKMIIID